MRRVAIVGAGLEADSALGLDFWADRCPAVDGISFAVPDGSGGTAIEWSARLDAPSGARRTLTPPVSKGGNR